MKQLLALFADEIDSKRSMDDQTAFQKITRQVLDDSDCDLEGALCLLNYCDTHGEHRVTPFAAMFAIYLTNVTDFEFMYTALDATEAQRLDRLLTMLDALFPTYYYADLCEIWSAFSANSVRDHIKELYLFNVQEGNVQEGAEPDSAVTSGLIVANVLTQADVDEVLA